MVRVGRLAVLALAASCGSAAAPSGKAETVHARLNDGTAALVGNSVVSVSLVAGVARSQHTDPRVALDRLIADALAAEGARATGQDRDPSTARLLESIIARSTTEHIQSASRAAGPPTDAEVAELTASYWRDVDLPEQVKVIHAVVVHPKDRSQDPAARALAAQLGRTPRAQELAEALGVDATEVEEMRRHAAPVVSIHEPIGNGEGELGDLLPDDTPPPEELVRDDRPLAAALATVKPGDRRVLELRYGLGEEVAHSYREIAQELRITTEGVRHAERRALSTLARAPSLKAA